MSEYQNIGPASGKREPVQSSSTISFVASIGQSSHASTLIGVKVNTEPETYQSVEKYLRDCGLYVERVIYTRTSMTMIIKAFLCRSNHGDLVMVMAPRDQIIEGGDFEVEYQRETVHLLPTNISNFFLEKVRNDLYTGYAFICNAGIQYFPAGSKNFETYIYGDVNDAIASYDLRKHYYLVIPAVAYEKMIKTERLNTLQIAFEKAEKSHPYYADFAKVILESKFLPLLSSEATLTILVPPGPPSSNVKALASHIIIKSFPRNSPNTESHSVVSATQAGNKVEVFYVDGDLDYFMINDSTGTPVRIDIDTDTPSISKFNGVIHAVTDPLPAFDDGRTLEIPATSDLDNVYTIFDLSKSAIMIQNARQKLDVKDQEMLMQMAEKLGVLISEVAVQSHEQMQAHFSVYRDEMNAIQSIFYDKEVPCKDEICEIYDSGVKRAYAANEKFQQKAQASAKLTGIVYDIEALYLKLLRIQQEITVEKPIDKIVNPDF